MWTHSKKYKGKTFFGNYSYSKAGKFSFKLENSKTGKELKSYPSYQAAQKDGWVRALIEFAKCPAN